MIDRRDGRRLFGLDPQTYDAARPGHPDRVYEILAERCGLRRGTRVLEIGPGTGQATRRLLDFGASLTVVEPNDQLADHLEATFGARIDVLRAPLEDAELRPAAFELVAAASAFHWVDEVVGLATIHTALSPRGWIALWWTHFGDDSRPDPFIDAVDPLFEKVPRAPSAGIEGRPSFGRDAERRLEALARAGFEDLGQDEFRWSHEWDAAGIRGLYSTFSPVISLDPDQRAHLLDEVERIARTQFGGQVEKPLVTTLYTARKPA